MTKDDKTFIKFIAIIWLCLLAWFYHIDKERPMTVSEQMEAGSDIHNTRH